MMNLDFDPNQASLVNVDHETSAPMEKPDSLKATEVFETQDGQQFYGGEGFRKGEDQMLLARMLKGIVPVSDVVFIDEGPKQGQFYSYKIPLEKREDLENKGEAYGLDKAKVDALVLAWVFGDTDHYRSYSDNIGNLRSVGESAAFYDFEQFANFWSADRHQSFMYDPLFERALDSLSADQKQFLDRRLSKLSQRFGGEEGLSFLDAIVQSIEETTHSMPSVIESAPDEDKAAAFQKRLLERIAAVQDMLANHR